MLSFTNCLAHLIEHLVNHQLSVTVQYSDSQEIKHWHVRSIELTVIGKSQTCHKVNDIKVIHCNKRSSMKAPIYILKAVVAHWDGPEQNDNKHEMEATSASSFPNQNKRCRLDDEPDERDTKRHCPHAFMRTEEKLHVDGPTGPLTEESESAKNVPPSRSDMNLGPGSKEQHFSTAGGVEPSVASQHRSYDRDWVACTTTASSMDRNMQVSISYQGPAGAARDIIESLSNFTAIANRLDE